MLLSNFAVLSQKSSNENRNWIGSLKKEEKNGSGHVESNFRVFFYYKLRPKSQSEEKKVSSLDLQESRVKEKGREGRLKNTFCAATSKLLS